MRKGASFRCALLGLVLIAATVAAQARSSWQIDPSQTHVRFWVDAVGWPRTTGEFKSFEGPIDIDFAIGLHVAAALKHHFTDKDTVLLRMLPFHYGDKYP
jgi:polyisoprenoid-binding protein YceI